MNEQHDSSSLRVTRDTSTLHWIRIHERQRQTTQTTSRVTPSSMEKKHKTENMAGLRSMHTKFSSNKPSAQAGTTMTTNTAVIKNNRIRKPTIRTITVFLTLQPNDLEGEHPCLDAKVTQCSKLLQCAKEELMAQGYEVQTTRIATNPFGEWMIMTTEQEGGDDHAFDDIATKLLVHGNDDALAESPPPPSKHLRITNHHHQMALQRLDRLDELLAKHQIEFCSLGCAHTEQEADMCVDIISRSHRFACSQVVEAGNVEHAKIAARTILAISKLGREDEAAAAAAAPPTPPSFVRGGLGNFRFCAASYCQAGIPFFPAARAESLKTLQQQQLDDHHQQSHTTKEGVHSDGDRNGHCEKPLKFAIGMENGPILQQLLNECQSIGRISTHFRDAYAQLLLPIQEIAQSIQLIMADTEQDLVTFLGIDSSINPSLDAATGSVAAAMEQLEEIHVFGGHGTLAAAAEITKAIQSLPEDGIQLIGYCGLMLPLCEDTRLAELASKNELTISDLLNISSVCGVGVDTVPIAGDVTQDQLTRLILDVAGIAGRWNKPLSCRVFPVPGKKAGEMTTFDSPYMVNSQILSLE